MIDTDTNDIEHVLQERFAELPESVQQAITDASVEEKLRNLAEKHKLHLDQWVLLEREIMLTLLGIEDPEDMVKNIAESVRTDKDTAQQLVNDIAVEVFQPVREQMQRELDETPEEQGAAPAAPRSNASRDSVPAEPADDTGKQEEEKKRPSDAATYRPGEKSTERRDVQGDPYREPIE